MSAGTAGGPGAVRRIQRDLIVLAASLAVFAGCAVVASDGRVGPAERAVFHAVNGLPGSLRGATRFGGVQSPHGHQHAR